MQKGTFAEAAEIALDAWTTAGGALGPDDPLTLRLQCNLACVLAACGHEDAEHLLRLLIASLERTGRTESAEYGKALYNLGEKLRRECRDRKPSDVFGKLAEADQCFGSAHDLQARILGPRHVETLRSLAARATTHLALSEFEKAADMLGQAYQGLADALGDDHPETLRVLGSLGVLYWETGDHGEAERLFRHIIHRGVPRLGPMHDDILVSYVNLSRVLKVLSRSTEAEECLLQALSAVDDANGGKHPLYDVIVNELSDIQRGQLGASD
jgi:tetratricopeptide (TPR) repeat protein